MTGILVGTNRQITVANAVVTDGAEFLTRDVRERDDRTLAEFVDG